MPYSSLEKIGYSSTIDFEVVLIYGGPYNIDEKKVFKPLPQKR